MKVPVLIDDDLILTDTRAILIYLAESSDYYSHNKRKCAIINQRLFYDAAVVFPSLIKLIKSIILQKKNEILTKKRWKNKDAFQAVMRVLDGLLVNKFFFANDEISIADIAIFSSVFIATKLGMNISQFSNLSAWFKRIEYLQSEELSYCAEHTLMLIKNVANIF
ncbi:hypothetical protein PVAND_003545 [Polypedilum vanderplanki]|uniref:glutathione transferase n=1 Tax=Polypedilum vanderplanki TaxID=319348 RepID=A0A9J6BVF5_POLVA|nr:hypothetical protein PVAND_003545 [Polypedilum vanderplanki]